MTVDLDAQMKRRNLMLKVNGLAAVVAVAAMVAKFRFEVWWALYVFVAVLLIGFAAQVWFVYSITSKDKPKKKSPAAKPHASKGA